MSRSKRETIWIQASGPTPMTDPSSQKFYPLESDQGTSRTLGPGWSPCWAPSVTVLFSEKTRELVELKEDMKKEINFLILYSLTSLSYSLFMDVMCAEIFYNI